MTRKFHGAWKYGTEPTIKKIFKVVLNENLSRPYDEYKFVNVSVVELEWL